MFTRCLVCARPFEVNEDLEYAPSGKRLAYDPARGRLWVICRTCRRWSLMPIEDRWEALEELEKVSVDRARLLSQTDNISLMRVGPLEIVRVGQAQLTEEAWWRYGKELASQKEELGEARRGGDRCGKCRRRGRMGSRRHLPARRLADHGTGGRYAARRGPLAPLRKRCVARAAAVCPLRAPRSLHRFSGPALAGPLPLQAERTGHATFALPEVRAIS